MSACSGVRTGDALFQSDFGEDLLVVNIWNSLPTATEADTINTCNNRLHKHWTNRHVLFNFNVYLIGIGTLPIFM